MEPDQKSSLAFTTVEETLDHPGFLSTFWDLEPDLKGRAPVGQSRGPVVNIAYEVHGAGPIKLVLIMGLAGVKNGWQRQTKYFGHTHPDKYSVLILDNRGVGESDKPLRRYSTSDMALDVIELLDHLGWTADRDIHLAGISLGGMIAQEVAARIPRRLQSLSLLSTSALFESEASATLAGRISHRLGFLRLRSEDDAIADTARKLFTDDFLAEPEDPAQLPGPGTHKCRGEYLPFASNFQRFQAQELAKRRIPGYWSLGGFLCQLLAAGWHRKSPEQLRDMADQVGRDRILVMHGTRDSMIELPNGEKLIKWIEPRVGLIVEGMGHVPIMERPDWFHGVFEDHIAACSKLV
ncbi:3-oxoadipate enol-lactonase 2 [Escovopsis weberi]|uniref:3-oxoadipate enol-lactonase 2 n=1 Tax=Escovopsis weberi TaxID=150374 RepID=A0A0M8MYZ4_ESCWE|nr:3-oxoadipate enol-lactonase 2 [Escovopsis weberi]